MINHHFFNCVIMALKPSNALSKFSTISSANTSGSGKLSRSASDLSFNHVVSKEVLSLAMMVHKKFFRSFAITYDHRISTKVPFAVLDSSP